MADKELELFREEVSAYCKEKLLPCTKEWDKKGEVPAEIYEEMAKKGFFKKCSNNNELGFKYRMILAEELGKVQSLSIACSVINTLNMPLYFLEKFQSNVTDEYLRGVLEKGHLGAIAVTEEYGGSDLVHSVKTAIEVQEDEIVINGTKKFILNIPDAKFVIVFGKTNQEGNDVFSFSTVLVPIDYKGVKVERRKTTGIRGTKVGDIIFDNVIVPKEYLLGKVGNGYMYMGQALTAERVIGNIPLLAMVKNILKDTINYTCSKELFGKKLFDMQIMRHSFADMAAEYEITYSLLMDVARQYSEKKLISSKYQVEVAKAKLMCGKKCVDIAEKCNHILGGQGFLIDNWIPRAYLDILGSRFFAGSNETMMQFISQKI